MDSGGLGRLTVVAKYASLPGSAAGGRPVPYMIKNKKSVKAKNCVAKLGTDAHR